MNNLHYEKFGNGPEPFLILHGLFGSSKNWRSVAVEIAARFANRYCVYTLDLRNHGRSFFSEEMNIRVLSKDIVEWANHHRLGNITLLGHSLGGLVAMDFAFHYPLKALVVADIAPKNYPYDYEREFKVFEIDISRMKSRKEIEEAASNIIEEPLIRNFLLMNAEKTVEGYRWSLNFEALRKFRKNMNIDFNGKKSFAPSLFIRGENSEYTDKKDEEKILTHFPGAQFKQINGAGHWLHFTHKEEFINLLQDFLS